MLYDAECAFCRVRWLDSWSSLLRRRGCAIDVLQTERIAMEISIPQSEILSDIRL